MVNVPTAPLMTEDGGSVHVRTVGFHVWGVTARFLSWVNTDSLCTILTVFLSFSRCSYRSTLIIQGKQGPVTSLPFKRELYFFSLFLLDTLHGGVPVWWGGRPDTRRRGRAKVVGRSDCPKEEGRPRDYGEGLPLPDLLPLQAVDHVGSPSSLPGPGTVPPASFKAAVAGAERVFPGYGKTSSMNSETSHLSRFRLPLPVGSSAH